MEPFVFPALFEAGENGGFVVSFPDVPEAITQGEDRTDAFRMAEEALGLALLTYPKRGKPLPKPRAAASGLEPVAVAPETAAKLAVLSAFQGAGISKTELARRLQKDEKEVRRILNPMHPTKLSTLTEALRALDMRLIVGVENVSPSVHTIAAR